MSEWRDTPGFQPKAVDVVKLNTNENPYPPSPKVMEAIRNLPAEKLRRYPEPMGIPFVGQRPRFWEYGGKYHLHQRRG